jgi:hypothetical protein
MDAYVFKLTLADDPRIWRTVALKETQTLDDLHEIIQEAFGWDSDHLYAFFMSNRKQWRAPDVYGPPDAELSNDSDVPLTALGLKEGKEFLYLFDFGDEWLINITFEERTPIKKGTRYPTILESHGEAPSQYGPAEEEEDGDEDEEDEDEDLGWREEGEEDEEEF